jgi:uncharacterized protein YndB with AHSA1/START domain
MAEFEASQPMPADAEIVFDVAADVERMGRWLPSRLEVESEGGDRVHVVEQDGGVRHEADGLVRVRQEQLRVEWGRAGSPDYTGWLQVAHADAGASEVTLHLSLQGDVEKAHGGEAADRLRGDMNDALRRLSEEVTRRVGDAS